MFIAQATDLSKLLLPATVTARSLSGIYTGDETLNVCHYCQWWRFEKIGAFLLKSQLDPHRVCVRTFKKRQVLTVNLDIVEGVAVKVGL
jgi:hypothetical protein